MLWPLSASLSLLRAANVLLVVSSSTVKLSSFADGIRLSKVTVTSLAFND